MYSLKLGISANSPKSTKNINANINWVELFIIPQLNAFLKISRFWDVDNYLPTISLILDKIGFLLIYCNNRLIDLLFSALKDSYESISDISGF